MAFTPNTVVHFMNVPLENNYKNQIYFEDRYKQTEYMMTKQIPSLRFENLTYQRKDNVIRVPMHIDDLWNVNYVMYKNQNYSGDRWFYAFVTKMEYVNDGRTDVYIETDVWQTWFDKITLKESFVEREHVEDDTVGLHTVPELLETGDYICKQEVVHEFDEMYIVVGTTQIYEAKEKGGLYGGCYSGVHYLAWKVSEYDSVNSFLNYMDKNAHAEAIQCVFMAPKFLIENVEVAGSGDKTYPSMGRGRTTAVQTPKLITKNTLEAENSGLNGYFPSNNKLWCYPYNYLLVSNHNGANAIYQYEYFNAPQEGYPHECGFEIYGTLCPGGSIKLVPQDYKNISENYDEALNLGKFPICNWNSDVYTNWLTQNSVNLATDLTVGVGKILVGGASALSGAPTIGSAGVSSGAIDIAHTIGQIYQHSLIPPQAQGNLNSGDVLHAMGKIGFSFYKMTIKKEFAQIIDKYFEMYGYKVNTVKVPKLKTRPHWNYIKTIDVNLDGEIPQDDLKKVRFMFDNGVTFWHDGWQVENYSLNNH